MTSIGRIGFVGIAVALASALACSNVDRDARVETKTSALTINQGTLAVGVNGGNSGTLGVATLSINPAATLDLADNDLIVNSGTFSAVKNLVLSGFGTSGPGIISSTSDGTQILALFDNALVGGADWNGQTIAAGAIVGKYTFFGDVNFDGQVTGDDYTIIDSNLNTTPPVGMEWLSGDANLDGIVTGDDYTTIDSNLGLGAGNPLSPNSLQPVPEPSALAALIVGAGCLIRRRRS